ncbi:MAG: protocatechuate 3,4-dioxygenase, alpha subunit [Pseudonocardiales bacterium]|jgi:protocatechuate 3,4-dioxygenase alpha subunit|nr:protocatechuate 3,4-dioxygenase, alpha subunit [Pseudonocardiales bacterium]
MTEFGATPSQTVGPFLSIGLVWADGAQVAAADTMGGIEIAGQVFDGAGEVVPDALIEIWQADPDGRFPHPDDPRGAVTYPGFRSFGRCATDATGHFSFHTLKPGRVDDEQAPHVDVTVLARGLLKHLVTRLYFPDETAANVADPVLATLAEDERARLVAVDIDGTLHFDIHLQGERETPFFAV